MNVCKLFLHALSEGIQHCDSTFVEVALLVVDKGDGNAEPPVLENAVSNISKVC